MGNALIGFYYVTIKDWDQMGIHTFEKVCRDNNINCKNLGGYYFAVAVPSCKMYLIRRYCNKIEKYPGFQY